LAFGVYIREDGERALFDFFPDEGRSNGSWHENPAYHEPDSRRRNDKIARLRFAGAGTASRE
jgi:hypothetical protein